MAIILYLASNPFFKMDNSTSQDRLIHRGSSTHSQPYLKVLITRLLLVLEAQDGKPAYRKSWAGNLLLWSDLTLDPSFKVNVDSQT